MEKFRFVIVFVCILMFSQFVFSNPFAAITSGTAADLREAREDGTTTIIVPSSGIVTKAKDGIIYEGVVLPHDENGNPIIIEDSNGVITASPSLASESFSQAQCNSFIGSGNPSNNLISSALSLCIPGVIYNLERLEQADCQRILCEYEAMQNGLSPIMCAKQHAYNTCLIQGEGYDFIEGLLIGSLRQQIRAILQDPLALGVQYLRRQLTNNGICPSGYCTGNIGSRSNSIILAGLETVNAYGILMDLENQASFLNNDADACEQLDDIKGDLQDLISEHREANS